MAGAVVTPNPEVKRNVPILILRWPATEIEQEPRGEIGAVEEHRGGWNLYTPSCKDYYQKRRTRPSESKNEQPDSCSSMGNFTNGPSPECY